MGDLGFNDLKRRLRWEDACFRLARFSVRHQGLVVAFRHGLDGGRTPGAALVEKMWARTDHDCDASPPESYDPRAESNQRG